MWIIKSALAVLVILALLGFSFQNNGSDQVTTINIGAKQFTSVPIIIVMYVAFSAGVIFWFIISVFQYFRWSNRIADLKRKNKQLLDEIKVLRNLPLEEIAPQDLAVEPEQKA